MEFRGSKGGKQPFYPYIDKLYNSRNIKNVDKLRCLLQSSETLRKGGFPMTQAQINEYLEKAKSVTEKAIASKAEARKLLAKNGYCTTKGQLTKTYRSE